MAALAAAAGFLRCPHCRSDLTPGDGTVRCVEGHSFDVARHGHVSLLGPGRRRPAGDSAEMVAARAAFLGAGHYALIAEAVSAAARTSVDPAGRGCVVEIGAGTAYYLAAVLRGLGGRPGLALDSSAAALRRAVRADPRVAGIACDAWGQLPVKDGAAGVVLSVFAPRNASEIARILAADGALVVVTPAPGHLGDLVERLGMIGIGPDKTARLGAGLAPYLQAVSADRIEFALSLDRAGVRAVAGMGPSAHHIDASALERRVSALPERVGVTVSVIVHTFRPRSIA